MNKKHFNLKVKEIVKLSQDEIVAECTKLLQQKNLSYKQKKSIKRLKENAHYGIIKETITYMVE